MLLKLTAPSIVLRVEGAADLALSIVLYRELGTSWWLFVLLFMVPDLALFGYLVNSRTGAVAYNVVHTYVLPALAFAVGLVTETGWLVAVALIWAAHIGADRLFGRGLKYPEGFRRTHLQKVGE